MAGRIRTIKPEILEDERSAALSSDAWRLWVSMWLLADDFGHVRSEPRQLHASVFWARQSPVRVNDLLDELEASGRLRRYQVRGQSYAEIVNWAKHQRIDNASTRGKLPGPNESEKPEPAESLRESPRVSAARGSDLDLDLEGKGKGKEETLSSASPPARETVHRHELFDFEQIYAAYPRKGDGKTKGIARLKKQIRTRETYEQALQAARHYADKTRAEQTPLRFQKQFSTWANGHWRDYVDGPHIVETSTNTAGTTGAKRKLFSDGIGPQKETREEKL